MSLTIAGTGPKQGGLVAFRLKDDAKAQRQFSILLAAKVAGTSVTVDVDDTIVDTQGICYL